MTDSPSPSTRDLGLRTTGRQHQGQWFAWLCATATWSSFGILTVLMGAVAYQATGWVNWHFFSSFDSSSKPEIAGILSGLWGTGWVIGFTILFAVPVGIGAAVYLEEFARDNLVARLIRVNLANLAGVPSILYGILGLTVFVQMFGMFEVDGLFERTLVTPLTKSCCGRGILMAMAGLTTAKKSPFPCRSDARCWPRPSP